MFVLISYEKCIVCDWAIRGTGRVQGIEVMSDKLTNKNDFILNVPHKTNIK